MIKVIYDKGGTATEKVFPSATCWQDRGCGIEVRNESTTSPPEILGWFPHDRIIMIEKVDS